MATININGNDHEINITKVYEDGTYDFHDATTNEDFYNSSATPTWVMGIQSPIYLGGYYPTQY